MSAQHAPLFHWASRRLHLLFFVMFGLFNSQYMNTNLAITITCMVNYTAVEEAESAFEEASANLTVVESGRCGRNNEGNSTDIDYGGTLEWNRSEQNWLFSASFWGGVFTVIPSILLAHRLSPKVVFAAAIATKAAANAALPLMATIDGVGGFYAVFAARFVVGMAEPFVYPSVNTMISNWFPMEERSTAVALFTTGNQLAMFLGNPIAASLCQSSLGWPAVYYLSAFLGVIWLVIWFFFAANRPSQIRWMTREERHYLTRALNIRRSDDHSHPRPPWKALATNTAFLSHLFATYSIAVAATFMITYLPTYFKQVLLLGLMANGTFTSLPMFFNFAFKLVWGVIVDKLKEKGCLTPTWGVKISQCFPTFGVAIPLLLVMLFVDCGSAWLALGLFSVANMFLGGHTSGAYTSLLSLAPQYTSTLSSISHAFSMISQLTSPFIVHALITKGSVTEWNRMLLFTSVLCVISGIQFLIWGSGEIQEFAKSETTHPKKEKDMFLRPLQHSMRTDSISLG